MARGGYRKPTSPAPVSGPGPMSQRTDGGPGQPVRAMTGGEYGEGKEMQEIQQGAKMANSGVKTPTSAAAPADRRMMRQAPDLMAPTDNPAEPITAGAPVGPGGGPEMLSGGMGTIQDAAASDAQELKRYLPSLMRMANQADAPKSFVKFVQRLRDA